MVSYFQIPVITSRLMISSLDEVLVREKGAFPSLGATRSTKLNVGSRDHPYHNHVYPTRNSLSCIHKVWNINSHFHRHKFNNILAEG